MSLSDQRLALMAEAIVRNNPLFRDQPFNPGDTTTVSNNATLTVTFTLQSNFDIYLKRAVAEAVSGVDYSWIINGEIYNTSDVDFTNMPKIIPQDQPSVGIKVVLIAVNTSGASATIGSKIEGFFRNPEIRKCFGG